MAENNVTDKAAQLAVINKIHNVEGFDPSVFAVEYTDLNKGDKRKKLPVMIQMAWFRLVYPEGKIAVPVEEDKGCFVARARVYTNYKDAPDCFLAEATASRKYDPDKPMVSPREWAQTAAIGIALRNAGFGLQFDAAGDDWQSDANDTYGLLPTTQNDDQNETEQLTTQMQEPEDSPEEKYRNALSTPCPITKYNGKSLGEVVSIDPNAIVWVATKYTGDPNVSAAAQLICEQAMQSVSA